jgi:hypothetical protein
MWKELSKLIMICFLPILIFDTVPHFYFGILTKNKYWLVVLWWNYCFHCVVYYKSSMEFWIWPIIKGLLTNYDVFETESKFNYNEIKIKKNNKLPYQIVVLKVLNSTTEG